MEKQRSGRTANNKPTAQVRKTSTTPAGIAGRLAQLAGTVNEPRRSVKHSRQLRCSTGWSDQTTRRGPPHRAARDSCPAESPQPPHAPDLPVPAPLSGSRTCDPATARNPVRTTSRRIARKMGGERGPSLSPRPRIQSDSEWADRFVCPRGHLTSTSAPASTSLALAFSASSLVAFSSTFCGAPSTRSFASLRPRLVISRTTLMT